MTVNRPQQNKQTKHFLTSNVDTPEEFYAEIADYLEVFIYGLFDDIQEADSSVITFGSSLTINVSEWDFPQQVGIEGTLVIQPIIKQEEELEDD